MDGRTGGNPFEGREQQDVLRLTTADGSTFEGSYLTQAGMHFLHCKDGSLTGKVEGPFLPTEVETLTVLRTRDEVLEERYDRKVGDPVPGRLVRTRDGYEARLDRLARAAASAPDFTRRRQVEAQFDEVADEIALAKTKRRWMLVVARWMRHSNEEPTKIDMAGGDMTMAEKFQRPRPQDFDPDPAVRRRRVQVPDAIRADPMSVPNMMRALRAAGFKARASVFGEITLDGAELLVDFPGGKQFGRFSLTGKRGPGGHMEWRGHWDGNGSMADERRRRRSVASEDYAVFARIVRGGWTAWREMVAEREEPQEDPEAAAPRM